MKEDLRIWLRLIGLVVMALTKDRKNLMHSPSTRCCFRETLKQRVRIVPAYLRRKSKHTDPL